MTINNLIKLLILFSLLIVNTACATLSLWEKEPVVIDSDEIRLKGFYSVYDNDNLVGYCSLVEHMPPELENNSTIKADDCLILFHSNQKNFKIIDSILSNPINHDINSLEISIFDRDDGIDTNINIYVDSNHKEVSAYSSLYIDQRLRSKNHTYYYSLIDIKAGIEKSSNIAELKEIETSFPVFINYQGKEKRFKYATESTATRVLLTPLAIATDVILVVFWIIICADDADDEDSGGWSFC